MKSYTTQTKCKYLAKQKIKVLVEGCESLTDEQIADLAGQQIRREFNDVLRDITGGQTETYIPTPEDKELVRKIEETGEFVFNIATHLDGKGTRTNEWDELLELSEEEFLKRAREMRDRRKALKDKK